VAKRSPKAVSFSRRSKILARVLEWINSGAYVDQFDYILFGYDNIYDLIDGLADERPTDNSAVEAVRRLVSEHKIHSGRKHASARTSLRPPPEPKQIKGLKDLSDWYDRQKARRAEARPAQESQAEVQDSLDAFYANEMVRKLEKAVHRASLLDVHEIDPASIGSKNVRDSFEEAHKCYLYGFSAGCAVLCRATLEAALKSKFDPNGKVERGLRKEESLITKLLESAKLGEPLEGWASCVRTAGGRAVHDYAAFSVEYESRMPEILTKTRAVLAAL
jgi:hypothetical protein